MNINPFRVLIFSLLAPAVFITMSAFIQTADKLPHWPMFRKHLIDEGANESAAVADVNWGTGDLTSFQERIGLKHLYGSSGEIAWFERTEPFSKGEWLSRLISSGSERIECFNALRSDVGAAPKATIPSLPRGQLPSRRLPHSMTSVLFLGGRT